MEAKPNGRSLAAGVEEKGPLRGPELSRSGAVLTTTGDAEDGEVDRLAGGHHGIFLLGLAPSGARPEWGGAWSGAAALASLHPRGGAPGVRRSPVKLQSTK
jgi:hypothetical protein